MLPYSVSCSYPPALWLWKAKKSSVNSLHRDISDNQSRTKNTDRLVRMGGEKKMDISTQLAKTSISSFNIWPLECLREERESFVLSIHFPQVLCCLQSSFLITAPDLIFSFLFSFLLLPYQKKKREEGKNKSSITGIFLKCLALETPEKTEAALRRSWLM